jgi:hypothetical protein
MKIWQPVIVTMGMASALLGFFARDYDVFLYTFMAGSAAIIFVAALLQWGRNKEMDRLKANYKPYQLKLLQGVAKPLERRHLIPANKKK